jgi:hypothetical protein
MALWRADVCSVGDDGVPLRADGKPVTIGEFSNTMPDAIKQASQSLCSVRRAREW